jgi:hypothetical protein
MNRHENQERTERPMPHPTVIPTRRDLGLFPGWGVRF